MKNLGPNGCATSNEVVNIYALSIKAKENKSIILHFHHCFSIIIGQSRDKSGSQSCIKAGRVFSKFTKVTTSLHYI